MNDNSIWSASGAPISASMAREQLWLTTGGQTGVIGPWSLEVTAQEAPNNTVRINPGSFAIAATLDRYAVGYTSAPWQSYGRSIHEPINVPISPTGSSTGRTDVVGIVIRDPEWDGLELSEAELADHSFWEPYVAENVGDAATRPEHFAGLGRPFLPLAQVKVPRNTTAIDKTMITDLRFLAVSRSHTRDLVQEVSDTSHFHIPATQTDWLTVATFSGIQQPQWATVLRISMMLGPVYTIDDGANGQFRVRTSNDQGGVASTAQSLFVETLTGASERFYMHASGVINLGLGAAGGNGTFELQIRRTNTSVRTGRLVIPSNDTQICRAVGRVTYEEIPRRRENS